MDFHFFHHKIRRGRSLKKHKDTIARSIHCKGSCFFFFLCPMVFIGKGENHVNVPQGWHGLIVTLCFLVGCDVTQSEGSSLWGQCLSLGRLMNLFEVYVFFCWGLVNDDPEIPTLTLSLAGYGSHCRHPYADGGRGRGMQSSPVKWLGLVPLLVAEVSQ